MEKGIAVNRVLRDLKQRRLITLNKFGDIRTEEVRQFAEALWVAGWEHGRNKLTAHNEKKVIKYNRFGKPITEYRSVIEAAKKSHCSPQGIYSAIERKSTTRRGYIWKYKEE